MKDAKQNVYQVWMLCFFWVHLWSAETCLRGNKGTHKSAVLHKHMVQYEIVNPLGQQWFKENLNMHIFDAEHEGFETYIYFLHQTEATITGHSTPVFPVLLPWQETILHF